MRPELEQREWLPGEILLGKYRILERIGAGGMGTVHAARRLSLGDVVAIKSVLSDRGSDRNHARFLREARALARIRHPNVVQVFDFGEAEGRPFMVMEYVGGPTLAAVLAAGRPPLARALELFADISKPVDAGHRRGVVHRDLKPGNVMLAHSDDGSELVKVLDFGLATLADEDDVDRSRTGALVGTCAYMSPETIEQGASGPASDVFALGVMLYELVTGELPYRGPSPIATIMQVCEGKHRRARERVPELPESVDAAIEAALQRDPAARPSSAMRLAALASGTAVPIQTVLAAAPLPADDHPTQVATELGGRRLRGSDRAGSELATEVVPRRSELDTLVDEHDSSRDSQRVRATLAAPPFVGRSFELDTLLELLTIASPEETPIAVILGEPGSGRTRLLRRFAELARAARSPAPVVYEGRFWAYDGEQAPAGETFLRLLGAHDPQADSEDVFAAGVERRSGFAALARRFEAHAAGRPQVLILDDLQLASSRDLEFLTYLVGSGRRPAPIVIVASARLDAARSDAKTELARWLLQLARRTARTTLTLAAFDDEQIRAWLEAVFGRLRIHPSDLRRLARASAGNPYVLSELVRHLVVCERIQHSPSEGGWVCERLADDVLPEGVASAVADQLASLPDDLRSLLETAAVIGERLHFEILARATQIEEDALDELVDDAVTRGLLAEARLEDGADLRFRSPTVRRVLYERLGARRRKRVHARVIAAVRETDGHDAKLLARHYRAIGDWPQTLAYGLRAARAALDQHDHDAAEAALDHARAALDALARGGARPGAHASVLIAALAGALDARVGRFAEGVTRLREARRLLEQLEPSSDERHPPLEERPVPALRFEVALALARCHIGLGQLDKAAEIAREAFELSLALTPAQAGGVARRLEAEWEARINLGHALGRFGEWTAAIELLEPIVDAAAIPRLRVLHVVALRERGWLAARSGDLETADRIAAQARVEAKACAEPLAEYCAASVTAVACSARGQWQPAIRHYREALRRARALSLRRREMIEQANLALALVDVGEHDEALQNMLSVRAICSELGDAASTADANVGLGRILRSRGNLDEASASFRRGHEACTAVGRYEYAGIALLELGRCELDRARWAAAREVLLDARARLTELRSVVSWEVELGLARAARGLGDEHEALRHAHAAEALLAARRGPADPARDSVDDALARVREFIANER